MRAVSLATIVGAALAAQAGGEAPAFVPVSFIVAPSGNDSAAGSEAEPFATIEHALAAARGEAARTSTAITLQAGVYHLDQPVRITSTGGPKTRFDGVRPAARSSRLQCIWSIVVSDTGLPTARSAAST